MTYILCGICFVIGAWVGMMMSAVLIAGEDKDERTDIQRKDKCAEANGDNRDEHSVRDKGASCDDQTDIKCDRSDDV